MLPSAGPSLRNAMISACLLAGGGGPFSAGLKGSARKPNGLSRVAPFRRPFNLFLSRSSLQAAPGGPSPACAPLVSAFVLGNNLLSSGSLLVAVAQLN
jgi:hypothetical protein